GDMSSNGSRESVIDFLKWFASLDYQYKIFIAGNHDWFFEKNDRNEINKIIPSNVIYLENEGIEIEGIKIWGSPISPEFNNWAFNRRRGEEINKVWNLIPSDTDILITHGPPQGILDRTNNWENVGCLDLLTKIMEIQPKFHLFGHIHEDYGKKKIGETTYINASILSAMYDVKNRPVVIKINN
ncbi:MAG: metallophosphatase domain-containing protein, partial [Candidatus Marinimicrobia bacterium]|nr:metallophosphatase domain-containing protein [Candidatus Neomarinimicrobiota bacterium]